VRRQQARGIDHRRQVAAPWTSRPGGTGVGRDTLHTGWRRSRGGGGGRAAASSTAGGHEDAPGEDTRNPGVSSHPVLAPRPGGACARSRGGHLSLREGPFALPLGGAEGGLPVLWQCVVWHHVGLSPPPWAGPHMPRKSLSVSDL